MSFPEFYRIDTIHAVVSIVNKDATSKALQGDARKTFMSDCLKKK